jgi:undecaprenyl-diphosphatase
LELIKHSCREREDPLHSWYSSILIVLEHYGVAGLFILSFVEASFFPLPPYLLLVPMTLANPQFGLIYALVGTIGSVLGGVFGYAIGFRIGRPILTHLIKPDQPKKLEPLFIRYGGWAIAIGGLTPIPYKIFAITAGVFRMGIFTFLTTSVIARSIHFFSGAVLLMLYGPRIVGYIHHSFGITKLIVLGVMLLVLLLFWRTDFIQHKLIPLSLHLKMVWQHWASGINSTIETLSRFGWFLIAGATLTVFSFGFFIRLAHKLLENELVNFDRIVGQAIISLRVPWLTVWMKMVTNFGSTSIIIFITLSLTVFGIIYRRYLIDFLVLDLCVVGALGLTELLKATFQRMRPPLPWLGIASGYSFPSGHALMTMSLYGFLAYLIIRNRQRLNCSLPLALAFIVLAMGVGISRVYLGVHYPSDVVAGWTVAAAWLGTCIAGREILWKAAAVKNN